MSFFVDWEVFELVVIRGKGPSCIQLPTARARLEGAGSAGSACTRASSARRATFQERSIAPVECDFFVVVPRTA